MKNGISIKNIYQRNNKGQFNKNHKQFSEFVKNFIPTQYRGLLQKTKLAFGDKRNFSPV